MEDSLFSSSLRFVLSMAVIFSFFNPQQGHAYRLPPRVNIEADASDYTVGQADILFPLQGDASRQLYLNPAIGYGSDNQGYADLGLGYRWLHGQNAILGGYIFGGYTRTGDNARLWVVNPGIEALGSRWDARLNAYFPMGDRHHNVNTFRASRVGWDITYSTGHSIYDRLFQTQQYIGAGMDAEVGYQPFNCHSLKLFLGSYFFNPAHPGNIVGGVTRVEYWFDSNIKLIASYSYDNVLHSTGAIGLGLEFGGVHYHRANPHLGERILDPIRRYLANLGHGAGIPNRRCYRDLGWVLKTELDQGVEQPLNNVAYFRQGGSPDDGGTTLTMESCTIENPCGPTDFSEAGLTTLNTLLPGTHLYFNGGTYPALNGAADGPILLGPDQHVYSYTADYSELATGTERSLFEGGFILNAGNELHGVLLENILGSTAIGVLSESGPIVIDNSVIGTDTNRYSIGIHLKNTTNAVMSNTVVYGSSEGLLSESSTFQIQSADLNALKTINLSATGIFAINSSGAIDDSIIFSSTTGFFNTNTNYGIRAKNDSFLVVNTSDITMGTPGEEHNTQVALFNEGIGGDITMNSNTINLVNDLGGLGGSVVRLGDVTIDAGVMCFKNGSSVTC